MDITPIVADQAQQIQRYGGGLFVVSGMEHRGSVLVHSSQTVPWPAMQGHAELTETAMAELIAYCTGHEIIIIGTGKRLSPLSLPIRQQLKESGARVDVMDTGAACRTYNVLMSEGRKVLAALIAI